MIDEFLGAITKQLSTTFGTEKYKYYIEDVEQKLKRPCFTVMAISPLQRSVNPYQYDRTMPIVVHFFSDSKDHKIKDSYQIGEQISECLEYLNFKDCLIRGDDISWNMNEDVLQFFITYRFRTNKIRKPETNMEKVSSNFKAK